MEFIYLFDISFTGRMQKRILLKLTMFPFETYLIIPFSNVSTTKREASLTKVFVEVELNPEVPLSEETVEPLSPVVPPAETDLFLTKLGTDNNPKMYSKLYNKFTASLITY